MAELASGAVSSLLGLIGNEARLLGGVRGDVQFIKEEMESMNSFLVHLARTAPPGGEHGEQVRTWMNQVRILANDCNNCIDKYVYRGDPDVHLRRSCLWRYLMWPPWFLRKMVAQHHAAGQLRVLKDRAREVGERRMRYDVKVLLPHLHLEKDGLTATEREAANAAVGVDDEDGDDDQAADGSVLASRRAAIFKHSTLDDYFQGKLLEWTEQVKKQVEEGDDVMQSAAVVAPEADQEVIALARRALAEGGEGHRCVVVEVDIPQMHMDFEPLRPQEILYYIMCQLHQQDPKMKLPLPSSSSSSTQQVLTGGSPDDLEKQYLLYSSKREISRAKESLLGEAKIQQENVMDKLDKMKGHIQGEQFLLKLLERTKDVKELEEEPMGVLFSLLVLQQQAAQRDQVTGKAMRKLAAWHPQILRISAEKLKKHLQQETVTEKFDFYDARYGYVLHKVFARKASNSTRRHDSTVEGQIKGMLSKVTEVVRELQDDMGCQGHNPIPQDVATETEQKIDELKKMVREQMEVGWIVGKITENYLKDNKRLIVILRIGDKIYESNWDENRYAFTRLEKYVAGVLIVTTTKRTQQAKESLRQQELIESFRQGEPMDYSLAGLYHDIVLQLTSHLRNEDLRIGGEKDKNEDYSSPQIIRDILGECDKYEFCMKILAHSFYARPKRSNEELSKLRDSLRAVSPKSFEGVAVKMLKFSYNDLPKEYKSCLLYLAIFPPGRSIRRSTLVSRWVVEGLISREDWNVTVRQAERCFNTLVDRGLVDPAEISGTGKVKKCKVGDRVHGFITMIAKKQHIVEARLSQRLAHHFSIFSDIRLRASEDIEHFLQVVPKQYHFSRLKVLDLEGVGMKNKSYLKDICCNLLLLKYLNLRRTNITQLPREINHLHELEVLDIRHNNVHKTAIRDLRLLKLKRLLAGCIDDPTTCSVELPEKIGKMEGMEVLLGVMPRHKKDFERIPLCLRKLGVVINKDSYLQPLLKAISDLHENLRSLSITVPISEATPQLPTLELLDQLESLSISGITQMGAQLPRFASFKIKSVSAVLLELTKKSNQLTKVTLSSTRLHQDDLKVLAQLPKLYYLKLRHNAYDGCELTFKENEFKYLKCFLVEDSNMTIIFDHGATPKLEKMLLPFTEDLQLSGVENLEKLEELELRNSNSNTTTSTTTSTPVTTDAIPVAAADTDTTTIDNKDMLCSLLEKGKEITKVTLRGITLRQDDLRILGKQQALRCLVLLDTSDDHMELTFNENEFLNLNLLIVECSYKINKISFTVGSCPKLEKFVTNIASISDISNLLGLKELEVKGESIPTEVKLAINKLKDRLHFTHYKSEN